MQPARFWLGLVLVLAATPLLLADGKVFGRIEAVPTIPDQSAIIAHADGVQTLVIETRFEGAGEEFAWIVPLPARPEIFEASRGTFDTARWLLRPVVQVQQDAWATAAMFVFLALLVFTLTWSPQRRAVQLAFASVLTLLVFAILSPALGKARGSSGGAGVEVLERREIAGRDVAVLDASDASSFSSWLASNGFVAPPGIEPVVARSTAKRDGSLSPRDCWRTTRPRLRRLARSARWGFVSQPRPRFIR